MNEDPGSEEEKKANETASARTPDSSDVPSLAEGLVVSLTAETQRQNNRGKSLVLRMQTSAGSETVEQMEQALVSRLTFTAMGLTSAPRAKVFKESWEVEITDWPLRVHDGWLLDQLRSAQAPRPTRVSRKPNFGVAFLHLAFRDATEYKAAYLALPAILANSTLQSVKKIRGRFRYNDRTVTVSPTLTGQRHLTLDVVCSCAKDADLIYSRASASGSGINRVLWPMCWVDCSQIVFVKQPHLWSSPSLVEMCRAVSTQCGLAEPTIRDSRDGAVTEAKVEFGGSPSAVSLAVRILQKVTRPMTISVQYGAQALMMAELEETGQFQTWNQQLGVLHALDRHETDRDLIHKLTLYGPHKQLGAYIRQMAEYADGFTVRFRRLPLSQEVASLFHRAGSASKGAQKTAMNSVGWLALQPIAERWREECSVRFSSYHDSIDLCVSPLGQRPASQVMSECCDQVQSTLQALIMSERGNPDDLVAVFSDCVCAACKQTLPGMASTVFPLCGHGLCASCAQVMHDAEACPLPFRCPEAKCGALLPINDLHRFFGPNFDAFVTRSTLAFLSADEKCKFAPCPQHECQALLLKSEGFQVCVECGLEGCVLCGVSDKRHVGLSCEEIARIMRAVDFGSVPHYIYHCASSFVDREWNTVDLGPAGTLRARCTNPALLCGDSSPVWRKFRRALQAIGVDLNNARELDNLLQCGKAHFAWHGTSDQAIAPICHTGFDPGRRSGQAYGRGEYFGVSPAVSMGYVRGCSSMLVVLLVHGPCTHHPGFAYVVDNPRCFDQQSFCLPVMLVSWNTSFKAPQFLDVPSPTDESEVKKGREEKTPVGTQSSDRDMSWQSPFRWFWEENNHTFHPYRDAVNLLLEHQYASFRGADVKTWRFLTPPIVRFDTDEPQIYEIDFSCNQQRNVSTRGQRRIERRRVHQPSTGDVSWSFLEGSTWTACDPLIQDAIERAFQAYNGGVEGTPGTFVTNVPGRPEQYQLDFVAGMQTNLSTGTQKPIRRL